MSQQLIYVIFLALLVASPSFAQTEDDPFPDPIEAARDVISVAFEEFAIIPDFSEEAPRLMNLVDEPGTQRLFINDMWGLIYSVSYDGKDVTRYINVNANEWGVHVQPDRRERGLQNFAFHPQFGQPGTPGYGRFYTWTDTTNMEPAPDFDAGGGDNTHDTVLLEWKAKTPGSQTYDGGPPRELMRLEQPFRNHNGGKIGFNPYAKSGDSDYGLLFVGIADGGSGGDPFGLAQNLASGFGKILRIDPLGSNSANGAYGIPADNPFASDSDDATLAEIYAYGVRNPQHFAWDLANNNMLLTDIGQNIVEEVSLVTLGANLGWNTWEGSFRYLSREGVSLDNARGDQNVTYPLAEYAHKDPLLQPRSSVTGLIIYRANDISQLKNLVLWGDLPSGEIFYLNADILPNGGQAGIRRVLLNVDGESKTLLEVIQAKNREQRREPSVRADLRFGSGPNGQVFILNKGDGVIRRLIPNDQ